MVVMTNEECQAAGWNMIPEQLCANGYEHGQGTCSVSINVLISKKAQQEWWNNCIHQSLLSFWHTVGISLWNIWVQSEDLVRVLCCVHAKVVVQTLQVG